MHECYSDTDLDLKRLLKRGALITAANWQTVAIQFVAETTFQMLLAVPIVGAALMVAVLLGGDVANFVQGPIRDMFASVADALTAEPVALGAFVAAAIAAGSTVVSDGWSGYARLEAVKHDPKVVGDVPVHLILPWVHRVFANAKRWALGVYHGLRPKHLQAYLDEFVFRFNRRHTPHAAFDRLLGLSLALQPATYEMLVGRS